MAAKPAGTVLSERELARMFDYRGSYGAENVALFVGADAAALRQANFTVLPLADLSGLPDWRLWALVAHAPTPRDALAVRVRLNGRPHATIGDVTFALLDKKDVARDWPRSYEDIPVPQRRVRPTPRFEESPLYPFVAKRAYNDIIAAAVARVSSDELYATDAYLSSEEIFSRQSASSGLLAASAYLQDRLRAYGKSRRKPSRVGEYTRPHRAGWVRPTVRARLRQVCR